MKKLLCIVLSLVMALSVCTVAFAAETTEEDKDLAQTLSEKIISDDFINAFNGQSLEVPFGVNVNDRILNGGLNGVQFLGMDIGNFLYSKYQYPLDWGHTAVSKGDMATFWGELNTYIVSYLKPAYTNYDRLCTAPHATAICNFIGRLLYPNYQNKTITFDSSFVIKKTFYTEISDKSGLTDAIINGWLTTTTVNGQTVYAKKDTINYTPVMNLLNIPLFGDNGSGASDEIFEYFNTPSMEYKIPSELGGFIIKSVVENAINDGPIQYLLNVLATFVNYYSIDLAKPILALFAAKMADGVPSAQQVMDFDVFFNMLANDNNPNSSRLQFITFPAYQYSRAADNTERFLYLMTYTNLLGRHLNNKARVEQWKTTIRNSGEFKYQSKKDNTIVIMNAMFLGDLSTIATKMRDISEDNLNNITSNWGWNFGDFFARLYRAIAMFFDGIFRTLKNGINLDLF